MSAAASAYGAELLTMPPELALEVIPAQWGRFFVGESGFTAGPPERLSLLDGCAC